MRCLVCAIVTCSLWSQDLCICHLATNLLPGYNTPFLISIGSHRTRVERLISLDEGGKLQDVSVQNGCQEVSVKQTKCLMWCFLKTRIILTDTAVVGAYSLRSVHNR